MTNRRPRLLPTLAAVLLCAGSLANGAAAEEPLRIAFIAYQNPDQLLASVEPVQAYLEERLGRSVESRVATDYAAIVEALKNESADVGFMGPLQYVIAHREAGAYPILGEVYNGSPTYRSKIFVRRDAGIREIDDLAGKTVAFVDPLSSSGYLYPLDILRSAGVSDRADDFFRRVYFAGGDEQAIRAVLNRFVDAAGIGEYSLSLLRPDEREQVIPIAESRSIPSHGVVVRQGIDPELASALQDALLALNEGAHRELLQHLYSVDGYVAADHETYREVEELARSHGLLAGADD